MPHLIDLVLSPSPDIISLTTSDGSTGAQQPPDHPGHKCPHNMKVNRSYTGVSGTRRTPHLSSIPFRFLSPLPPWLSALFRVPKMSACSEPVQLVVMRVLNPKNRSARSEPARSGDRTVARPRVAMSHLSSGGSAERSQIFTDCARPRGAARSGPTGHGGGPGKRTGQ